MSNNTLAKNNNRITNKTVLKIFHIQRSEETRSDPSILRHRVEVSLFVEQSTGRIKLHDLPRVQDHHPKHTPEEIVRL